MDWARVWYFLKTRGLAKAPRNSQPQSCFWEQTLGDFWRDVGRPSTKSFEERISILMGLLAQALLDQNWLAIEKNEATYAARMKPEFKDAKTIHP